jgi:hypothetical protein
MSLREERHHLTTELKEPSKEQLANPRFLIEANSHQPDVFILQPQLRAGHARSDRAFPERRANIQGCHDMHEGS